MTEHYSVIKINEVLIHSTLRMNIKTIMLREKKPVTAGHILYDSIHLKYSEIVTS